MPTYLFRCYKVSWGSSTPRKKTGIQGKKRLQGQGPIRRRSKQFNWISNSLSFFFHHWLRESNSFYLFIWFYCVFNNSIQFNSKDVPSTSYTSATEHDSIGLHSAVCSCNDTTSWMVSLVSNQAINNCHWFPQRTATSCWSWQNCQHTPPSLLFQLLLLIFPSKTYIAWA